jgi:hypothetical protein
MTVQQTQTRTRPDTAIGTDDFDRVVEGNSPKFVLIESWQKVDGIDTARGRDQLERQAYVRSLGVGASACREHVKISREMRTDMVYQLLELPGRGYQASEHINSLMQEIPEVDFAAEGARYNDSDCMDLFTRYSLMTSRVYCRATIASETLQGDKLAEAETISRALLGGIITKATQQLEAMCKMNEDRSYSQDQAWELRGRIFELMRFMYFLSEWRGEPDPSSMYVRFASEREDEPHNGYVVPNRSFDLVVRRGDGIYLEQDKTKGRPEDYRYAEPIKVVVPKIPLIKLLDDDRTKTRTRLLDDFKAIGARNATPDQITTAREDLERLIGDPSRYRRSTLAATA